jgi:hypothetical protein
MSTPVVNNRQNWQPAVSDKPTPGEQVLNTRLLFTAVNQHDQAIVTLKGQVDDLQTSMNSTNTTTEVVQTVESQQFPGLGQVNNQTGAYTTQTSDNGALLIMNDASAVTVTLNASVSAPFFVFISNQGAGVVTLTPSSGTLTGASTLALNTLAVVVFDGTNWWSSTYPVSPQNTPAVAGQFITSYTASTGAFTQAAPTGLSVTIATAKLTTLGANGSMTFTAGILTAQTPAT